MPHSDQSHGDPAALEPICHRLRTSDTARLDLPSRIFPSTLPSFSFLIAKSSHVTLTIKVLTICHR
jgi:hypothetical protein